MRRRASTALAGLLSLTLACQDDSSNVPLSPLGEASDLAVFCVAADVDETGSIVRIEATPVPLTGCQAAVDFRAAAVLADTDVESFRLDGNSAPRCEAVVNGMTVQRECLFGALVTQVSTGELAFLILDAPTRNNRFELVSALDTNDTIPGATFARVGERPTAVAVDPNDPELTYVANLGSRSVQAFRTQDLFDGIIDVTPAEVFLNDGPVDLVLTNDAEFLYAAVQGSGELVEIDVDPTDPESPLGAMRTIDLSVGLLPGPPVAPPVSDMTDYSRICAEGFPSDQVFKTVRTEAREPAAGPVSSPVDLHLDNRGTEDASDDVLLVADRGLPFVRRFAVGGGATEESPINTAVPTLAVTTTPPVPAQVGETSTTERYLYAIDATDGTVLAVDYEPTSAGFGAVLPTSAGDDRRDRLSISGSGRAVSLEVITPNFDIDLPDFDFDDPIGECDPADESDFDRPDITRLEEAGPLELKGVFLMVGLGDGTVRVMDVYDLDATCRGVDEDQLPITSECSMDPEDDGFIGMRRHRPRNADRFSQALNLFGTATLSLNDSPGGLDELGNSTTPGSLSLLPIECPIETNQIFPFEETEEPGFDGRARPRICAGTDIWATRPETWRIEWEGRIDGTRGGLGRFDPDVPNRFLTEDAVFCSRGVLGATDVVASGLGPGDPEQGYAGDMLVIVGELPFSSKPENAPPGLDCTRFVDNEDDNEDTPVAFLIEEARQDQLSIGEVLGVGYTLQDVIDCYPEFIEYEVRTNDAYAVTGTVSSGTPSGFLHRVDALGFAGQCRVDLTLAIDPDDSDTFVNGRAFPGEQFINPFISFAISEFDLTGVGDRNSDGMITEADLPASTSAALIFSLENTALSVFLDTGTIAGTSVANSLPSRMRYFPTTRSLFVVDPSVGVGRARLQPLFSPGASPYDILLR